LKNYGFKKTCCFLSSCHFTNTVFPFSVSFSPLCVPSTALLWNVNVVKNKNNFEKKIKKANLLGGALGAVGPNAQQAAEAGAKIGGFFKSFF
jgi:hypothetical protein